MWNKFRTATLGKLPTPVCRLGLSASYWPGKQAVFRAIDQGVNYFFMYGFDGQMTRALREVLPGRREQFVVASGAYNLIWMQQDLRRALEKRLRQLRTDYLDVFLFLGVMKPEHITPKVRDQMEELRHDPRVRAVGMSCHDRVFAGNMAAQGALDVLMIRYNAAHRGAEREIFPQLAAHRPGVVSYTATRWRKLLMRPRGWKGALPTAPQAYRFVLSNPHVDVCMTAPSNLKQLEQNLAALSAGPLPEDEMRFMREFGDTVHGYFM
ncbi:MAG: aldo/keto reductase [Bryobacteraceae bacterium]